VDSNLQSNIFRLDLQDKKPTILYDNLQTSQKGYSKTCHKAKVYRYIHDTIDDDGNPNTETEEEDSDDELALHGVIQTIPHSLIKSSGTEAERYLNEPLLKKGDKRIYAEFWKDASTFYPILSRMARDYGTILSTSVLSELVFSIAGLQITKRRNRLAPKTMGVIMCLRSWGLINEEGDDNDEESDDGHIRKDRAFGRMEPDKVV
jgi:hypothetical protein